MRPEQAFSPAAERNKQPILERLQALLPAGGRALEIASGTGQHVAWFAAGLPGWVWQPSALAPADFGSITAWCEQAGLANVRAPRRLDLLAPQWPAEGAPFAQPFDLVYCANLLHIAPWACCAALMRGAARHLAPGGLLVVYGPFLEDEVATAASNLAFDADLRARDPAWGLRRREDVAEQARLAGLEPSERQALPANNLLLVFRRSAASTATSTPPAP